jgi:hypothetical protein
MLRCHMSKQAHSLHSHSLHQNESKILPCKPTSRTTRLSRNRRRQTTPKLYRRTLFIPNKNAVLYPYEQSTNYQRQHEVLEGSSFWACKQRKRQYKNKQRNTKQLESQTDNRVSSICWLSFCRVVVHFFELTGFAKSFYLNHKISIFSHEEP